MKIPQLAYLAKFHTITLQEFASLAQLQSLIASIAYRAQLAQFVKMDIKFHQQEDVKS